MDVCRSGCRLDDDVPDEDGAGVGVSAPTLQAGVGVLRCGCQAGRGRVVCGGWCGRGGGIFLSGRSMVLERVLLNAEDARAAFEGRSIQRMVGGGRVRNQGGLVDLKGCGLLGELGGGMVVRLVG